MHIILGCDDVGKEALSFYRKMNSSPDCLFCDVDDIRNGDIIEGTRVISFKEMKNKSDDSDIVIADEYAYVSDIKKAWDSCRVNSCTNYKSGILCGCSMIEAFEKMNRQFGTSYQMIEEEDYFDLYKTKQSIHDILSAFRKPKHICGYCDSKPATWFDWSLPNEEISVYDYVVDGKR